MPFARPMLLTIAALLSGCAAPPAAVPPVDFTLDAAVVGQPSADAAEGPRDWLGHRFVVMPDGTLHHDVGQPIAPGHLPPPRRVLGREAMTELWSLVEEAGLTGEAAEGRRPDLLAEAAGGPPAMVVLVGARGRWWSTRQDMGEAGAATLPLLRRLSVLAWAGESARQAVVAPKRYDFGPDPYERYRR